LTSGDDYELVFTAPPAARDAVQQAAQVSGTPVVRIGHTVAQPGLTLLTASGQVLPQRWASFDHFA
jgi:thiamine-monophosphate kinase